MADEQQERTSGRDQVAVTLPSIATAVDRYYTVSHCSLVKSLPDAWARPGIYLLTFLPTGERYLGSSNDVRRRLAEHLSISLFNCAGMKGNSRWQDKLIHRGLTLQEVVAGASPCVLLLLEPGDESRLATAEAELHVAIEPELNGQVGGRSGSQYRQPRQWPASRLEEYLAAKGYRAPARLGREGMARLVLGFERARLRKKYHGILPGL
jgi:hypothetical protein